ncbi:MAG: hypothetical protein AAF488_12365 [Planctomycetota bacterium]
MEAQSPRVLDSLALAHFLGGEPGKAAALIQRAIDFLDGADEGSGDDGLRGELQKKFDRYAAAAEEAGLPIDDSENAR